MDGTGEAAGLVTVPGRAYLGYMDREERFAVVSVVAAGNTANTSILKVPIAPGAPPTPLAASGTLQYAPTVSPDGRWLAYVSTASNVQEVYVREMDGTGQWQISTGGGVGPQWSPDGRELFYRNDSRQMVVAVQTSPRFAPGTARVLFDGAFNWRTEAGMNYTIDPVTGAVPDDPAACRRRGRAPGACDHELVEVITSRLTRAARGRSCRPRAGEPRWSP